MSSVAIYARVSTDDQARGEHSSLDIQLRRCQQRLESHHFGPGQPPAPRVYRDEGFSGKNTNRPAFQRLMRDVRNGHVDTVIIAELSRLSRSVTDFLALVEEFESHGVSFISLRENVDTTSPQGRLLMTVMMALNQFEREQTSLRTRLNMRSRAEQGLWSGGVVPLGYKLGPPKSGRLEVDEEAASIVRSVFETYVELGSISETVRSLAARGLGRPSYQTRAGELRPARPLGDASVRNMLQNPTYRGLKEVNRKARRLPREEQAKLPENERYRTVDAAWPAIVSEALFARATRILERNRATNHSCLEGKRHDFILSGLVHCRTCGELLQGERV